MEQKESESSSIEGDIEEDFGLFSGVEQKQELPKSKPKQRELEKEFDLFSNDGEIIVDAVDIQLDDNRAPVDLQSLLEKHYKNKIGLLTKDNYKQLKRPLVVAFHKFNENLLKHRKWIDLLVELSNLYFLSRHIGFFVADASDISLFYHDAHCFNLDYEPLGPTIFAVDRLGRPFEYTGLKIDILRECPERNQFKIHGAYGTKLMDFIRRFQKNQLPAEFSFKTTKVKYLFAENFIELVENIDIGMNSVLNIKAAQNDLCNLLVKQYKNKIGLLTEDNYKLLKRPLVVAFHTFNENSSKLQKWITLFVELSERYEDIQFYVADLSDISLFHHQCSHLTAEDGTKRPPHIYAVDTFDRQFPYTGVEYSSLRECHNNDQLKLPGTSATTLKEFVERLQKNQLFLFSEPLPVETEISCKSAKANVAVAGDFNELVENAERDVLIVFYVNWCPFSKLLLPDLDELSMLLADDEENLSIVTINSEFNYISKKYCVNVYPTIMFLPKNDKKNPVRLRGSRSIEGLIQFIAKNSTVELKRYDRNGNKRNI